MTDVIVTPVEKILAGRVPRSIGGIQMQVTIEEEGTDEDTITEHPVEQGAAISDHAYAQPARLSIRAGSTNADPQGGDDPQYIIDLYNKLLALRASFELFTVVTGKRIYNTMLFRSLTITTTGETENTLMMRAVFQQLIIVETQVTSLSNPADPSQNGPTQQLGTLQAVPDGSFLAGGGVTGQ